MSSEKSKIETYEGGSVLPPGVHDALIHGDEPEKKEELQEFDPEWYVCQTSVTLVGKFYYKEELKVGDGPYGRYCSFSLRTKKLKNGTPRTCFFYIKVWGNDLISLLERLPNETFIKVTGDLETWRNSTYIRARSITPMLNLDQHVEELKQKEFLARMENDAEAMEEIRVAREAMRDAVDKAQSVVDGASGTGYGEMTGEVEEVHASPPRAPAPKTAEWDKTHKTAPEIGLQQPAAATPPASEKEDESIMSAKQDLAYILDVLEDMEDYDDEDEDGAIDKDKRTGLPGSSEDDDYDDEDEDYDDDDYDDDDEDSEEVKVSIIETNRGEVMASSETTLAKLEEERYAKMRGEPSEKRKDRQVRGRFNAELLPAPGVAKNQEPSVAPPSHPAPLASPIPEPEKEQAAQEEEGAKKRTAPKPPRRVFGQGTGRRKSAFSGGGKRR